MCGAARAAVASNAGCRSFSPQPVSKSTTSLLSSMAGARSPQTWPWLAWRTTTARAPTWQESIRAPGRKFGFSILGDTNGRGTFAGKGPCCSGGRPSGEPRSPSWQSIRPFALLSGTLSWPRASSHLRPHEQHLSRAMARAAEVVDRGQGRDTLIPEPLLCLSRVDEKWRDCPDRGQTRRRGVRPSFPPLSEERPAIRSPAPFGLLYKPSKPEQQSRTWKRWMAKAHVRNS